MNQKNHLVIGGTGGIGQAIVKELLQRIANEKNEQSDENIGNTRVYATYHKSQPDFAADNLYWISMDVSDEDSIEQAIADIRQQTSHID